MPFVNYLPDPVRDRLVPHARAYTTGRLRRIYRRAGLRPCCTPTSFRASITSWRERKIVGRALRSVLYPLEDSPLRIFGLSHFVVLVKEKS